MNILYYDKNMSYEHLNDLWNHLKDKYPEDTLLFLPNSVQLLTDASAEQLFDIGDKIWVALEKIREERPEEYKEAHNNRLAVIRDKQWKEVLKKQEEKEQEPEASKIDNFINILKEMKNTDLTYKQIAETLHIKINTLYTWVEKKNIAEKRAIYLTEQLKRLYPEQYAYALAMVKK